MFYILEEGNYAGGDAEALLRSGYAMWDDLDLPSTVYLERVGPYVPPVYVAGGQLFCTSKLMNSIQDAEILGVQFFGPIEKRKIVNFPWQPGESYDSIIEILEGMEQYSVDDLLSNGSHDQKVSSSMPDIYRLEFCLATNILRDDSDSAISSGSSFVIHSGHEIEVDMFVSTGQFFGMFATERAKDLLEFLAPGCLNFRQVALRI